MKSALLWPSVLALMLSLGACAHQTPSRTGGKVTLVEDKGADNAFVIKRRTLEHALELGPSWFVSQLSVRPIVTRDENFYGFQLMSLFPGRESGSELPIRQGDIVRRINGQSIERPEQFMALWNSLGSASHLSIQVLRGDQPLLITWEIEAATKDEDALSSLAP